jgi:NAD(P)H-dependent flavin oxidoreductase YrpB (nitropropane dioxygenase family)
MYTELCKKMGIEVPIFAFTHCRDVVVEVSKAGGIGVFGAAFVNSLEELKEELDWIDAHIGDNIYGFDIVIPNAAVGQGGGMSAAEQEDNLWEMLPKEHVDFTKKITDEHGVPKWHDDSRPPMGAWTLEQVMPMLEDALKRPKCKVIVNALGTPPDHVTKMVQDSGRLIGALTGTKKHALDHQKAGLDFIVANGAEGGGHCGELGSIVCWPELIDAVAPMPVLAAGGVGNGRQMLAAMGMGAAGVWTGSLWLTVEEAHAQMAQKESYLQAKSTDAVRTKAWTGKGCRLLRNDWTEAWENPVNPDPLPFPLQLLLTSDLMRRTEMYASAGDAQKVAGNACGQVIGQINEIESCRGVVTRMISEYVDALEAVNSLMPTE